MDLRQQPQRGLQAQRGSLSRETIADAALALIEEQGIEQLTMRALAGWLDRGTMTLYTHVRNRDDLLRAIVERLIAEMDIPAAVARVSNEVGAAGGWQEVLTATLGEYRRIAEQYPRAFELLALAPYDELPVAPHLVEVIGALERTGLAPADARTVLSVGDAFATGFLVVWVRTELGRATASGSRAGGAAAGAGAAGAAGAGAGAAGAGAAGAAGLATGARPGGFADLEALRAPHMFDVGVAAVVLGLESQLGPRA